MALDEHIRAILAGAPELLHTPALATGLALGASQQMSPDAARGIAQSAAIAMHVKAVQDFQRELAEYGV